MKGCLQFTCSIKWHLPLSSPRFSHVAPLFPFPQYSWLPPQQSALAGAVRASCSDHLSAGRFGMQFPLVTLRFNFALIKSAQEASGSFTSMGARVIWQNNRRRIKTPTSGARGRRYILLIQFLTVLNGSGAKCSKSATGVGGRISPSGVR